MIIQNNIILIIDFTPIWSKYITLFLLIKTLNSVFFKKIFGSFSTFRKLRHPCPMVLPLQSLLLGWPVLLLQVKQQSGQRTALHQHHAEKRPCLLRQQGQRYRTNHRQAVLKDEVSPYIFSLTPHSTFNSLSPVSLIYRLLLSLCTSQARALSHLRQARTSQSSRWELPYTASARSMVTGWLLKTLIFPSMKAMSPPCLVTMELARPPPCTWLTVVLVSTGSACSKMSAVRPSIFCM